VPKRWREQIRSRFITSPGVFVLTREQIRDFREQILAELYSTIQELSSNEAGKPVELDQSKIGRLSRMDEMQQQAMAAGLRERLLLRKRRLEAALARVDASSYGTCCKCGEDVGLARLLADPGAPFCAICQEEISEQ
jgi:DnaK suppressor protein